MSPSAGSLIWISCRPLIRLAAGVASGFFITRADIFPLVAAQGAGQIALNITLPCLLFSKIVPAFTTDNIKALGPLVLIAVLYEALGLAFAWITKRFFWVPHRFRYGILIAGGWGNVGDLPTAVILSITGSAPFLGASDQNLSVAYISVFLLVFTITLFPCGFHRWLAWDFVGPDVEPEAMQAKVKGQRQRLFRFLLKERQGPPLPNYDDPPTDEEKTTPPVSPQLPVRTSEIYTQDDTTTVITSPNDTTKPLSTSSQAPSPHAQEADSAFPQPPLPRSSPATHTRPGSCSHYTRLLFAHARSFVKGLFNPICATIYVALPISLVPQLKALFIEVPGVHMPPAPDGQPPLAFIQDIATFIGAASIPIGLICLGSSLARLSIPLNQWRKLPIGAITSLAIAKMILTPILGVLICRGLANAGVLFKDDKVLLFVCMFFSCLPTATTQVYLTQVYSGTGSAEHLTPFLIPQYIIMFFSMTALNAYAIQAIF
ncbi:hypothetical protein P691DRAFT_709983 [Macrolepiota fuliginosa MF-IS2]|uniref:Auxin efflux carrier n=1 Tax=Macrolepiota fuliginosa MF-IS2 TaxID=1400762 RepID=A0A9P5X9Q3_9AGAR|nr:hypothetical protein P691DRAFT_709983 [Macrolepiota fuliginosa MF-IS2]